MVFNQIWIDRLLLFAVITFIFIFILFIVHEYAKNMYKKWLKTPQTSLDVDSFVDTNISFPNYIKITFLQFLSVGRRKPSDKTISLRTFQCSHVPGLLVTRRQTSSSESLQIANIEVGSLCTKEGRNNHIVIGTIRMGFGHHRIAYAACSWALAGDKDNILSYTDSALTVKDNVTTKVYFHDLLSIKSEEADLLKATDILYSKLSRISSNLGSIAEKVWGKAMLCGDDDALRISGLFARHLTPLIKSFPKDTPIIATHCYVALAAVAAGFTNIINLVIDNHAQWFVVVPGCLNLVQGPVNYQNFLRMGVKEKNIRVAGHWVPRDLALNIPDDCARRISRAKYSQNLSEITMERKHLKPRRILISIGGAGAQRKFVVQLLRSLIDMLKEGKVQLFLNCGDHKHMFNAFVRVLTKSGLSERYEHINTIHEVEQFRDRLLKEYNEPTHPVAVFSFEEYFPAVITTDILSRVTDILACKPGELAFYPVPKLLIRRVGDHEQYSATRSAELGDGTLEARSIDECLKNINLFIKNSDLLVYLNHMIIKNYNIGIYDGCKNAVQIALDHFDK